MKKLRPTSSRSLRQRDLCLSTLAQYAEALDATLKASAVFDDEEVEIKDATGAIQRHRQPHGDGTPIVREGRAMLDLCVTRSDRPAPAR
jgi:hypothetical protein